MEGARLNSSYNTQSEPGWTEKARPYLVMAFNMGIGLSLIFLVVLYFKRDHERHFPPQELSRFEKSYFEPVVSKNYRKLPNPRKRGSRVLMLVPARWSKKRKTQIYSGQGSLPGTIQAKSFAEADTIFYLREGDKVIDQQYYSRKESKNVKVKVRMPFVEMLAFDKKGKCKGFVYASAQDTPDSAVVFTKERDPSSPEISAELSFSPVKWVTDLAGD